MPYISLLAISQKQNSFFCPLKLYNNIDYMLDKPWLTDTKQQMIGQKIWTDFYNKDMTHELNTAMKLKDSEGTVFTHEGTLYTCKQFQKYY